MNPSLDNREDRELIRQTLGGRIEAFGELIRRYQNRLYNGMVHLVRNEVEAEDIVQDAFVLAMTKLDSFKGHSQFYTWLYRIAYNTAVTRIRRQKPSVSLDHQLSSSRFDLQEDIAAPGDDMQRREQVQQLMTAIGRLSDEHRSILLLREMEEMDYDAISEILDLPIGTVRSRLHRARTQLKAQLELMLGPD